MTVGDSSPLPSRARYGEAGLPSPRTRREGECTLSGAQPRAALSVSLALGYYLSPLQGFVLVGSAMIEDSRDAMANWRLEISDFR